MKNLPITKLAITSGFLASCSASWISDSKLDARAMRPADLTSTLGFPTEMIDQRIPPGKRKTKEYRYFVLDSNGTVQFRSYFYDGDTWVTTHRPFSDEEGSDKFRILDIRRPKDQQMINRYLKNNSYLSDKR